MFAQRPHPRVGPVAAAVHREPKPVVLFAIIRISRVGGRAAPGYSPLFEDTLRWRVLRSSPCLPAVSLATVDRCQRRALQGERGATG